MALFFLLMAAATTLAFPWALRRLIDEGLATGASSDQLLLGFAEAIGYDLLPGSVTYLLIFVAMIVFLTFKPNGLFGKPWG